MVAIVSHKREAIQRAVREMYTAVATRPDQEYHFPTGRKACELVGYPSDHIEGLPTSALESFAGVGYPFAADVIREGDHVLDIGSGSGTDALICARAVGAKGKVYALDVTESMRDKLRNTTQAAGIANLEILDGDAEVIPLPDQSVDVVTSNGVINLIPNKAGVIAEIFRVLKPGGRLQIADIALARPVAERFRQDPQMWAECVVGAVEEERYFAMLRNTGFEDVERLAELDYFSFSSNEKTREVAGLFNAHSIAFRAVKPMDAKELAATSTRRAALNLVREFAGVGAAIIAWLVCAGAPALLAAFGAIGASGLAQHAYMFPAFSALLGVSVWLIWRSGYLRENLGPFWLALAGAVFAIATTWFSLVGIFPSIWWWPYIGIAALVGASIWSFVLGRRPGDCLNEMIREAQFRQKRGSPGRRAAAGVLTSAIIAAALYGLYASINMFVPA